MVEILDFFCYNIKVGSKLLLHDSTTAKKVKL